MLNIFKGSDIETFQKELLKDNIDEKKIQKFIDNGLDINQKDEKGRTFLFSLVDKRKIEAIKFLIKNKIDLTVEDGYGKNILDEAISKADGMMIRFLLDNGFSLNYKNSSNRTVLQNVALEGDYRTFQILATYEPDYNLKDSYGKTVLFDAVNGENEKIVKEVVNNVQDVNINDENKETVLFSSVLKEDIKIAHLLVLNGVDVNHLNKDNQNVLFNAVLHGDKNLDFIKLLMKKGININQVDSDGRNILDEIIHILELQRTSKSKLEDKYSLIEEENSYEQIVSTLIKNGLDLNKQDRNGNTILVNEINKKDFENIEFLLKCGMDLNIKDKVGKTLLYKEVLKGNSNYKMIKYLIDHGANIENRDDKGNSVYDCLIDAILINEGYKNKSSNINMLDIEEEAEYDILLKKMLVFRPKFDRVDEAGKTILFKVIDYNDYELIRLLINYGVDPNVQDNDGKSVLHILVENGLKIKDTKQRDQFIERLVFILKFRINVDLQDNEGRTVYHKAVIADDLLVVEKLLTKKADLTIKDKQGRTALHHTKWNGNYKIARWLIASGADMNQPDSSGFTLLNYAAIFGHTNLVIALIASGVLMYNKNPKSKKVAQFFKERERNLDKLLVNDLSDEKMRSSLKEVVENTRNEVNEVLEGN